MTRDGEIGGRQGYEHARWCAGCDTFHGPLFECTKFSADIIARIRAESDQFYSHLNDPSLTDAEKMSYLERTGVVERVRLRHD